MVLKFIQLRLVIVTLIVLVLQLGVMDAYARCLKNLQHFGASPDAINQSEPGPASGTESLPCLRDSVPYTITRAQNIPKKDIGINKALNGPGAGYHLSVPDSTLSSRRPAHSFVSNFPHHSMPIYQFNRVYRI